MADGGRRKKEEKPRNGGAPGLLIGQRAPGRVEWHLGEAGLDPGCTTASGRSEQAALRVEGVVLAREDAQDACERGEVPRGKPGAAGRLPGSIWSRTRRGRVPPAAYGGRRAKQSNREERDGGEGISAISEIPGTCR